MNRKIMEKLHRNIDIIMSCGIAESDLTKLIHLLTPMQEYVENVLQLGMHRREGVGKLAAALKLRVQVS